MGGVEVVKVGSLFTGYGGLDHAVEQHYGAQTVWTSDIDPGACKIIAHRMPHAPNLGDITKVDWSQVEPVDILTGGYPCQPFSAAGERKGARDDHHLWPYVRDAIRNIRPRYAILENVAGHRSLGFDRVLGDMAEDGMHVRWTSIRASDVGAPHERERIFIVVTNPDSQGYGPAKTDSPVLGRVDGQDEVEASERERPRPIACDRAPTCWGRYSAAIRRWERVIGRHAPVPLSGPREENASFLEWMMGLPAGWVTDVPGLTRNAQLKALGNGVVPQQALAALRVLHAMEAAA
jgi:DNA (cytosine-5)-methyltransferase 1